MSLRHAVPCWGPREPRLPSARLHSLRNRNQKHSARAVRLLSHIPRLDQIKLAPAVEPIGASDSGAKFNHVAIWQCIRLTPSGPTLPTERKAEYLTLLTATIVTYT